MILDDQLRRIAAVSDLYTIGFDGVDVLGVERFTQAQKRKEEHKFFHKIH
jgi:hypothetical protein